MNRDGAMICCLCVYARCTAPAICQHSVVTSVEGALTDWDKREREIERERFPSPIRLPYLIFMSLSVTCSFVWLWQISLWLWHCFSSSCQCSIPGWNFERVCLFCIACARTHPPASPITAVVRCYKHDRNNSINYLYTDICTRGDAVSCGECFNCRLANEGLINGKND